MQHRILSTWFRHITEAGLTVRQLLEPEAESCPERVFNNNRPGEAIKIAAKKVVKIRVAKAAKEAIVPVKAKTTKA